MRAAKNRAVMTRNAEAVVDRPISGERVVPLPTGMLPARRPLEGISARLEPIDRRRHRAAREIDTPAQVADRLRSLVEQRFENREIGQTHIQRFDAALDVALQRPVGFHDHQPRMDA